MDSKNKPYWHFLIPHAKEWERENPDVIANCEAEKREEAELLSWIERAKVLVRSSKTAEEANKVKDILKEFRDRRIIFLAFKEQIAAIEKQRAR